MKRILLYGLVGCCALLGGTATTIPLGIGQTKTGDPPAAVDLVEQLSNRFETIARTVSPAVVSVEAVKPAKSTTNAKGKQIEESGSGVIIQVERQSGFFVITNNHVISGAKAEQITVQTARGQFFRPGKVWTDPETDIALLSLDGAVNLP